MEKRMSVIISLVFLASFVEFSNHLIHDWRNLGSQVRLDEVFLAGLFLALMVQLWNEKSKTAWMLMTTATIAFATATHLVLH
jgi:hypothetical protein